MQINEAADLGRASDRTEDQFARQADIVPQHKLAETNFTIIGTGSLGSLTTHALSMLGGEKITVYDDDVVELHNLATQLFAADSVKDPPLPKVDALRDIVQHCHKVVLRPHKEKFTKKHEPRGVVISCVDDMAARKEIWGTVRMNPAVPLYVDTRAAGRVASMFFINPLDLKHVRDYEEQWLFPQEEGVQGPCTEKMTTFIAWAVGAYVGAGITNFLNGEPLPYHLDIDMANMGIFEYGPGQ